MGAEEGQGESKPSPALMSARFWDGPGLQRGTGYGQFPRCCHQGMSQLITSYNFAVDDYNFLVSKSSNLSYFLI